MTAEELKNAIRFHEKRDEDGTITIIADLSLRCETKIHEYDLSRMKQRETFVDQIKENLKRNILDKIYQDRVEALAFYQEFSDHDDCRNKTITKTVSNDDIQLVIDAP